MSSWAVMLQGSPRGSCPPATRSRAKGGGAGGIRTLDRALQPYNGLANRRLQPLGHSSIEADMPDAGASRKRQIPGCLIQEPSSDTWTPDRGSPLYPEAGATHCYTRVANASRMRQCEPQEFFPR